MSKSLIHPSTFGLFFSVYNPVDNSVDKVSRVKNVVDKEKISTIVDKNLS